MDFEDRPLQRQGHHQAHVDDITLRTADDFQPFDVNNPFDVGPSDGIESGDFNELDIGIDWGGGEEANGIDANDKLDMISLDESVGVGRDAGQHRDSLGQDLLARHDMLVDPDLLSHASRSRDNSQQPFDAAMDMDVDMNLGIGFDDIPLDVMENTPGQTRSSSRACKSLSLILDSPDTIPASPLTELPATPPPQVVDTTVAQDAHLNKLKKKLKDRKQIIDSVTEISNMNRRGAAAANPLNTDISSITTEQHFLPRSSIVIRLLEIRDDPLSHFFPIQVTPKGTFFSAAPPGLTSELSELFLHPVQGTSAQKRKASSPSSSPVKRLRQDVEQARRAGTLPPSPMLKDIHLERKSPGIDAGFEFPDPSAVMDDFELGVPIGLDMDDERARSVVTDRSRQSSLGPVVVSYGDSTCPISTFDVRQPTQPSQPADVEQPEIAEHDKHGYSKNTMKALGLIRKELQPGLEEEAERKILSFTKMSHKVGFPKVVWVAYFNPEPCIRLPDVQPRLFSSSCSSSAREIALNFLNQHHLQISKPPLNPVFGNINKQIMRLSKTMRLLPLCGIRL
jgi:cohesin complex subunit SCC1